MRLTFLASLLFLVTTAFSQPTLTSVVNAPWVGDSYVLFRTAWTDPGPAGVQNWNYGTLAQTVTQTVLYVEPDLTPLGDSLFTGADVAWDDQANRYIYYTVDGAALSLVGIDSLGIAVPYSDAAIYLEYPCTFGTNWVDNLGANYTAFGAPVTRTGTVAGNADAYGSVQMPYGTVNDVLRVHLQESIHDQAILGSIDASVDKYSFYKGWLRVPFLEIATTTVSINGGAPTTFQHTDWLEGNIVGLAEQAGNDFELHVFPIPADDALSVAFTSGGPASVALIDATGRTVINEQIAAGAGFRQHEMDVSHMPSGLYLMQVTTADGARAVKRVIVDR